MELSHERVVRFTVALGVIGAAGVWARWGVQDSLGFLTGAALSLLSYQSWVRLAASLGDTGKVPPTGSAMFLILRYVLIGALIYVIVRFLGTSPASLVAGLLVSFAAVVVALLSELVAPSKQPN